MNHVLLPLKDIQTLAATVKCLTKQNHDLEEQMFQRYAGPNNRGEEKEGTSAQRRD